MATKFKGIKTVAEHRRGELTKDILRLVAAGVVIGTMTATAPNTIQLIDYLNPKGQSDRKRIWAMIKYLEQKKRIRIEERNDHAYVYLTSHGKLKFDEDKIGELVPRIPRRWDRKWRLVMFDFPTSCRTRHAFRTKLQDLGFHTYQRSVFIFPHECQEEVNAVARWYRVDAYIRYVVATEIEDMRRFVKLFDLL